LMKIAIVDHSEFSLDAVLFQIKDLTLYFDVSQSTNGFLYLYEETTKSKLITYRKSWKEKSLYLFSTSVLFKLTIDNRVLIF
jgi:hypothetical protein